MKWISLLIFSLSIPVCAQTTSDFSDLINDKTIFNINKTIEESKVSPEAIQKKNLETEKRNTQREFMSVDIRLEIKKSSLEFATHYLNEAITHNDTQDIKKYKAEVKELTLIVKNLKAEHKALKNKVTIIDTELKKIKVLEVEFDRSFYISFIETRLGSLQDDLKELIENNKPCLENGFPQYKDKINSFNEKNHQIDHLYEQLYFSENACIKEENKFHNVLEFIDVLNSKKSTYGYEFYEGEKLSDDAKSLRKAYYNIFEEDVKNRAGYNKKSELSINKANLKAHLNNLNTIKNTHHNLTTNFSNFEKDMATFNQCRDNYWLKTLKENSTKIYENILKIGADWKNVPISLIKETNNLVSDTSNDLVFHEECDRSLCQKLMSNHKNILSYDADCDKKIATLTNSLNECKGYSKKLEEFRLKINDQKRSSKKNLGQILNEATKDQVQTKPE